MTIVHSDDWLTIYQGDCRAVMAELEPDSINCVVTSPPYFSLRDYGVPPAVWGGDPEHEHDWAQRATRSSGGVYLGKKRWQHNVNGRGEDQPGERRQELEFRIDGHPEVAAGQLCECGAWLGCLGLEPTPDLFLEHIVEVFRGVRRVLRPDGVVWLNMGDSYASSGTSSNAGGSFQAERAAYANGARPPRFRTGRTGFKAKDRMLMPARVAIALADDGWYLRDEIVWAKSNPMPSSVADRTTPAHEMVYLLAKRARYWSDFNAIRERGTERRPEALAFGERQDVGFPGPLPDRRHRRVKVPGGWDVTKGEGGHGTIHREGRTSATYAATVAGHENLKLRQNGALRANLTAAKEFTGTRNRRSVWSIATQPYPEAHFATFPEALVEPMILAGCPEGGVVLDPFGGSGTVGVVAQRLGRRAVLIDLSREYLDQALDRNRGIPLGLAT